MSNSLNVNVLVAAKEEYTKQLVYLLSPEIYTVLLGVFNDSQLLKKKRSVSLRNFQIMLKQIPKWNQIIIEKNTSDIKKKIPYLLDLITAIFVSHVKILACVKLQTDSKSINVKVPNLDNFLHKIIISNAEKIYYNPESIQAKKELVIEIISNNIEQTIRNEIPIDKILTEYLAGVFDNEEEERNINDTRLNQESNRDDESIKSYDLNNSVKSEDLEDLEDLEEDVEEEEDIEENKNIIPTRPLPPSQLPELENLTEQKEYPENNIPTQEIKNKVLFSDAIEKSIKPKQEDEELESDDDDDEYTDESDEE
jgi:hypothetical protein